MSEERIINDLIIDWLLTSSSEAYIVDNDPSLMNH